MLIFNNEKISMEMRKGRQYMERGMEIVNSRGLTGIQISEERVTDKSYNLKFLSKVQHPEKIKSLTIYCSNIDEIESIYIFPELEKLDLGIKNVVVDLSKFPKLKEFSLRQGQAINVEDVKLESLYLRDVKNWMIFQNMNTLKELRIESIKNLSLDVFRDFTVLEGLNINACGCRNLKGIENFQSLRKLLIQYGRVLEDITGLSALPNLNRVAMWNCPKLQDLTELANCKMLQGVELEAIKKCDLTVLGKLENLELLRLFNCGDIPSLKFIEGLKKLICFAFVDTNVLDGDLTPCLRLTYAGTLDKRHYNLRDEDLPKGDTKFSTKWIGATNNIVEEIR